MRGLYAIVDTDFLDARGVAPLAFTEQLLLARPAAIQLRAKRARARDALDLARLLAARCEPLGVPFFINDRPDLALLAGASGVHLGQTDLKLEDVRRLAPTLRAGLSTHRPEEVELALEQGPSYLAFGPVFATRSKADAEPVVGLAALARTAERCRQAGVPLVAIGGIDEERAAAVAAVAGAAAVISALLPPEGLSEVAARTRRLHRALGGS
ncbi:MAG TPA: thiamine phosphate synthase [Polyangiaceae bacterium]|nr:thiamine phosphate synthase [Polyangiaceae bacterium]